MSDIRDGIIKLGLRLGSDVRETVKRTFYKACSEFLPTDSTLKVESTKLSKAGVAAKLSIPQREVEGLEDKVRTQAFPSGSTIVRMVGYVRRFPNALPDTSLEVYATAAAAAVRDGEAAKGTEADAWAETAVAEATADMGQTLSIRDARNLWQTPTVNTVRSAGGDAETVGDRVTWLISQPAAVMAYISDDATNRDNVTLLVSLLTNLLNGGNGITETETETETVS